ncbi:MAG: hypothetical protein OD817_05805, partial [Gammaproteobacteria bacterium]
APWSAVLSRGAQLSVLRFFRGWFAATGLLMPAAVWVVPAHAIAPLGGHRQEGHVRAYRDLYSPAAKRHPPGRQSHWTDTTLPKLF